MSSFLFSQWRFPPCYQSWGSRGCWWFRPSPSTSLSTRSSFSSWRTPVLSKSNIRDLWPYKMWQNDRGDNSGTSEKQADWYSRILDAGADTSSFHIVFCVAVYMETHLKEGKHIEQRRYWQPFFLISVFVFYLLIFTLGPCGVHLLHAGPMNTQPVLPAGLTRVFVYVPCVCHEIFVRNILKIKCLCKLSACYISISLFSHY